MLTACAPSVRPPVLPPLGVETPEDFPEQNYQAQSLPAPGKVFRIDAQLSELRILVYRGGELARFGHNHVVTSTDIQGFVLRAEDVLASRFDLFLPADRLVVDDPLVRAEEGADFSSTVSDKDSDGTRANMLGDKVLDVAQFPFLQLSGKLVAANESELTLDVNVTIHGATKAVQTVANMRETSTNLTVEGAFNVRQTDFGIEPFSALLGRLRVEDEVTVKYRIFAGAINN
ncbi:MAG: YceI family protein [Pseudomonadales bacterium]